MGALSGEILPRWCTPVNRSSELLLRRAIMIVPTPGDFIVVLIIGLYSTTEPAMYDREKLNNLGQSLERWEKTTLQRDLDQLPERQEQFITTSSEPVAPLYTPLN